MSWIFGELSTRQKINRHYRGRRDPNPDCNLTLSRTKTALVLGLPRVGIRKGWAGWIRGHCRAFGFNPRTGWWEAPLTLENYHQVAEAFTLACRELNISDGVQTWIKSQGGKDDTGFQATDGSASGAVSG